MLETLDRMNVKRLVLREPAPARTVIFDLDKEVTREHLQKMTEQMRLLIGKSREDEEEKWPRFAQLTVAVKVLFPEKAGEFGLTSDLWGELTAELEASYGRRRIDIIEVLALSTVMLYPDRDRKNLPHFSAEEVSNRIDFDSRVDDWPSFSRGIILAKFISPATNLDRYWRVISEELDKIKRYPNRDLPQLQRDLRFLLPAAKVAFPDKFKELKVNEDKEFWDKMSEELIFYGKFRFNNDLFEFAERALQAKLLLAEKIDITSEGFNVIMPKTNVSFSLPTSDMPNIRKF